MSHLIRNIAAAAVIVLAGSALTPDDTSARKYERNGIYAVGGNQFIVRLRRQGGYVYLRAYRLAGGQWERYGTARVDAGRLAQRRSEVRRGARAGIVERIYFTGRLIGYSTVDLDNPLNTELNRNADGCVSC